jgi:hypothetical protein
MIFLILSEFSGRNVGPVNLILCLQVAVIVLDLQTCYCDEGFTSFPHSLHANCDLSKPLEDWDRGFESRSMH